MKNKLLKYGLWILGIIFTLVTTVVIVFFYWFNSPDNKILSSKCDHEGLRKATVHRYDKLAELNPTIKVSVRLGCGNSDSELGETVFMVDNDSLTDNTVNIDWLTFDTLVVKSKKGQIVFMRSDKITYPDSTLNVYIKYQEVE
jgi:hypothetical protein